MLTDSTEMNLHSKAGRGSEENVVAAAGHSREWDLEEGSGFLEERERAVTPRRHEEVLPPRGLSEALKPVVT